MPQLLPSPSLPVIPMIDYHPTLKHYTACATAKVIGKTINKLSTTRNIKHGNRKSTNTGGIVGHSKTDIHSKAT